MTGVTDVESRRRDPRPRDRATDRRLRRARARSAAPAHDRGPRLRGADARSSARRSRRCWRAATCWPRRRPGPARPPPSRCPTLQRIPIGRPATAARPRSSWSPPASSRCRSPRRSSNTAARWAPGSCRSTAASRSASSCAACAAAWMSSSPRRAGRSTTSSAAACGSTTSASSILDEADEMLDMGFAEDLETILSATPAERQTALFSATISPTITRIAKKHLRDPARIKVHAEKATADGVALVRQVAYVVRRNDKLAALCRILDVEDPTSTLVFARTRGEVDDLAEALSARGHDAGALHGGLTQEARDRIMGRFRDGSLDVLVATDVAARGLDIEHVSHVVNFDVPSNPDAYVHRIGRTGRAGREGRRDHARRAARAPDAAQHRGGDAHEARDRPPADRRRPARAPDRDPPRQPARSAPRRRLRPVPRRRRAAVRRVRPGRHRPGRGQPDRGRRWRRGRRGRAVVAAARLGSPARGRRAAPPARAGPVPAVPPPGRGPARPPDRGGPDGGWVRLFVGGGRKVGLRPGDLVGAITNEAHVPGQRGGRHPDQRGLLARRRPAEASPTRSSTRSARRPSAAAGCRSGATHSLVRPSLRRRAPTEAGT